VVWSMAKPVMKNMLSGNNLALCTNRQVNGEFKHVGVSRRLINDCTLSVATKERTYIFPLWHMPDNPTDTLLTDAAPRVNLSAGFLRSLAMALSVEQAEHQRLLSGFSADSVFGYIYALLNCPSYRMRYSEFLKSDFPRLPLTAKLSLFRTLSQVGSKLVSVHLLESPELDKTLTSYTGSNSEVEKISFARETVWIDKAQTRGFRGVPQAVWDFHVGGYQVCEKWLKDRKGRVLSKSDIGHYTKIVVALRETIRLMAEIDKVIEAHGGWPDAFITSKN
jgi:predicted helicase